MPVPVEHQAAMQGKAQQPWVPSAGSFSSFCHHSAKSKVPGIRWIQEWEMGTPVLGAAAGLNAAAVP